MTNEQILLKAVVKAEKNGWDVSENDIKALIESYEVVPIMTSYGIIFDHVFAKTFWGTKKWKDWDKSSNVEYEWQYRLSEMVLEEEPLKYIEKFL